MSKARKITIGSGLALVFVLCFVAGYALRPTPAPSQWEYKIIPRDYQMPRPGDDQTKRQENMKQYIEESRRISSEPETVLNELGAQGWELVSFEEQPMRYVLKRKKGQK